MCVRAGARSFECVCVWTEVLDPYTVIIFGSVMYPLSEICLQAALCFEWMTPIVQWDILLCVCRLIALGRKNNIDSSNQCVSAAYQDNLFAIICINEHVFNFRSAILLLSASLDIVIIWEL